MMREGILLWAVLGYAVLAFSLGLVAEVENDGADTDDRERIPGVVQRNGDWLLCE